MKAEGADIVAWIAAYEGGFRLQAYACLHDFVVVSAVQSYTGRIIDRSGKVLAATSRWGRLASATPGPRPALVPYRWPSRATACGASTLW